MADQSYYLKLHEGGLAMVPCSGINLETITEALTFEDSPMPFSFCAYATWIVWGRLTHLHPTRNTGAMRPLGVRLVGWDNGLNHFNNKRDGFSPTWVRPWDQWPCCGPLMLVRWQEQDEQGFYPLDAIEAVHIVRAWMCSGWQIKDFTTLDLLEVVHDTFSRGWWQWCKKNPAEVPRTRE